jgi:hypothetical protein
MSPAAVTATVFLILIYSNEEKQYSARSRQTNDRVMVLNTLVSRRSSGLGFGRKHEYKEGADRKIQEEGRHRAECPKA